MTLEEYERLRRQRPSMYPAIPARYFNPPSGVVQNPVSQPPPVDEPVAAVPREAPRQGRVRICVTSYRVRLVDDDNIQLGAKPLVDAIVAARFVPSDAKIWCDITHCQVQISDESLERTEILLENL